MRLDLEVGILGEGYKYVSIQKFSINKDFPMNKIKCANKIVIRRLNFIVRDIVYDANTDQHVIKLEVLPFKDINWKRYFRLKSRLLLAGFRQRTDDEEVIEYITDLLDYEKLSFFGKIKYFLGIK